MVFDIGQNAFRVFYNHFTDKIRRIDKRIFNLPEDEHFEHIDDPVSPNLSGSTDNKKAHPMRGWVARSKWPILLPAHRLKKSASDSNNTNIHRLYPSAEV